MNITQKNKIQDLRSKGETYATIALEIGVSENTVKSYCRRNNIGTIEENIYTCPECRQPLTHLPHKRKKRFCSDKCRMAWWVKHNDRLNKKAVYKFTCQACGKECTAYGNSKRKYCTRACYGASRSVSDE